MCMKNIYDICPKIAIYPNFTLYLLEKNIFPIFWGEVGGKCPSCIPPSNSPVVGLAVQHADLPPPLRWCILLVHRVSVVCRCRCRWCGRMESSTRRISRSHIRLSRDQALSGSADHGLCVIRHPTRPRYIACSHITPVRTSSLRPASSTVSEE